MAVVPFPIPAAVEEDGPENAVLDSASYAKPRNAMHRVSITDKEARRLPLGSGAHLDRELQGFMVIANRTSRSYVLQRDFQGRAVRVTLGRVGEITADRARLLALEALEMMRQGRNPNEERRVARVRGMTLREAFKLFIESGSLAPKTVSLYSDGYERYLKPWADRTMEEIGNDRAGVHELHRQIQRTVAARLRVDGRNTDDGEDEEAARRHPPGWARANGTMRLLAAVYSRARRQVPTLPQRGSRRRTRQPVTQCRTMESDLQFLRRILGPCATDVAGRIDWLVAARLPVPASMWLELHWELADRFWRRSAVPPGDAGAAETMVDT